MQALNDSPVYRTLFIRRTLNGSQIYRIQFLMSAANLSDYQISRRTYKEKLILIRHPIHRYSTASTENIINQEQYAIHRYTASTENLINQEQYAKVVGSEIYMGKFLLIRLPIHRYTLPPQRT